MDCAQGSKFQFYYQSFKNGNYFGVKPTNDTLENIKKVMKKIKLNDPISHDDIHVTLMYSENKGNPLIPPSSELVHDATGCSFALYGPEKNCLVIKLKSEGMKNRHNALLSHGFIHSYDEFSPHITLSYNYQGEVPSSDILSELGDMQFTGEYVTPISDNWSDDK